MDLVAMIVGIVILAWIPIGPLVGYMIAVRGWRIRSPLARSTDEESL